MTDVSTPSRRTLRAAAVRRARRDHARRFMLHPPEAMDEVIPPAHWRLFAGVIREARARGIPFAIGGGLATAFYTGNWHRTKDVDLYVLPESREAMIDVTRALGLVDLYPRQPYDRAWIYRATRDEVIVDVMWALANGCGEVDEAWLVAGAGTAIHGEPLRLVAPEELLWSKVHVLQRERCDWPDLLNLLYTTGPRLDWPRVLERMAGDDRVLAALVSLFAWTSPARAAMLPEWLWDTLGLPAPDAAPGAAVRRDRVDRLDSRPWFTTVRPDG